VKKSALQLELDINEIQELQTMCTQPLVKNTSESIILQFETVLNKTVGKKVTQKKESGRAQWLEEIQSENGLAAIYNTETVLTSRSPHPYEGNYEMETNRIIH